MCDDLQDIFPRYMDSKYGHEEAMQVKGQDVILQPLLVTRPFTLLVHEITSNATLWPLILAFMRQHADPGGGGGTGACISEAGVCSYGTEGV